MSALGFLLMRQGDVEPGGLGAGLSCPAIGSLHHAGSAGRRRSLIDAVMPRAAALPNTRASTDHNRRTDPAEANMFLGLGIRRHEARPAHRAAEDEILIKRGQLTG